MTGNSFYCAIEGIYCKICGEDTQICKCPKSEAEAEELAKNGNKSDIKKIREIENKIKEQIISLGKERYLDNNKISKK